MLGGFHKRPSIIAKTLAVCLAPPKRRHSGCPQSNPSESLNIRLHQNHLIMRLPIRTICPKAWAKTEELLTLYLVLSIVKVDIWTLIIKEFVFTEEYGNFSFCRLQIL